MSVPNAQRRAQVRWSGAEKRRATPESCGFCRRSFKSERGVKQHQRRCYRNPNADFYVDGRYDPILDEADSIVGYISNGRSEQERSRIRAGFAGVAADLGFPPRRFGKSHRKVELGPDITEPCALCPESRGTHDAQVGACLLPGCGCSEFVGAVSL